MIPDIIGRIDSTVQSQITVYPQHKNRASSIGHPCERKLVYSRLNWKEQETHDLGLEFIFREGRRHEDDVVSLLREAGIQVQESQRSFEYEGAQLTGKIDGKIALDGKIYPLEIKSMHQHAWDDINSEQDIRESDSYYIRGYYDQMQVYLLMNENEEGIILLKNKQTGRIKQINITLNYEYAEGIIKKCERINLFVAQKEYPERINDKSVCSRCPFKNICLPDENFDSVNLNADPQLLALIKQRDELSEAAKAFEIVNDKLKEDYWPKLDAGIYLVGPYQVKISRIEKTYYNVPDEIKKPFALIKTETRSKVTPL